MDTGGTPMTGLFFQRVAAELEKQMAEKVSGQSYFIDLPDYSIVLSDLEVEVTVDPEDLAQADWREL